MYSTLRHKPKVAGFEFEIGTPEVQWQVGIATKKLQHARLVSEVGRLGELAGPLRDLLMQIKPADLNITGKKIILTNPSGRYIGYYRISDFTLEEL